MSPGLLALTLGGLAFCDVPARAQGQPQWAAQAPTASGTYGAGNAWPAESASGYYFLNFSGENTLSGGVGDVLSYEGDGPSTPPASQQKSLPVLITVGVSAADSSYTGDDGSTFSLSDGYGDPQVPREYGPYPDIYLPNYLSGGVQSAGRHLVTAPVSQGAGGVWQATVPAVSVSGSAASPAGADLGECVGMSIGFSADSRTLTLHRSGAVGETVDSSGVTHGATTFSYNQAGIGLGAGATIVNTQTFSPSFGGSWTWSPGAADWKWSPSAAADTPTSHAQVVPTGSLFLSGGSSNVWTGKADMVQQITISYSAQDQSDGAQATANYVLAVHDQYDNFRRVDGSGNPVTGSGPGTPGALNQIGQANTPMPGEPVLSYDLDKRPVSWQGVAGVGGGVLAGGGAIMLAASLPAWPATIVGLAGLALQTASSYPTDPELISAPDTTNVAFLQQAYDNSLNNSANPGGAILTNIVDTGLFDALKSNPDFPDYYNGKYGLVTVTSTVYLQMLSYYFYSDQYSTAGLVSTTASSTVTKPGGLVWNYVWHGSGGTPAPNPSP